MSSNNKPTFEDFYKRLDSKKYYALNGLCDFYAAFFKIDPIDPYAFLMLPEVKQHFDVYKVSQPFLLGITVLKKKI